MRAVDYLRQKREEQPPAEEAQERLFPITEEECNSLGLTGVKDGEPVTVTVKGSFKNGGDGEYSIVVESVEKSESKNETQSKKPMLV